MSEALDKLAARVAADPSFLANPLAEFARSEALDDAGLARALGCDAGTLTRVKLCRTPQPDPDGFRADVAAVATRFGLDAAVLTNAVRRGLSLSRLRGARATAGEPGFLLAARDEPPPPPAEPGGDQ